MSKTEDMGKHARWGLKVKKRIVSLKYWVVKKGNPFIYLCEKKENQHILHGSDGLYKRLSDSCLVLKKPYTIKGIKNGTDKKS